jgi:hypothetical protein
MVIQSSQVDANQTNMAVLITQDNLPNEIMDSDESNAALEGGGDIRVSLDAAGATQLALEVVAFERASDPANAKVEMHTKIPSVNASSNTTFYLWYNKAGESQPAIDSTYGAENVWNANYLGVWHMHQDPTGGAPQFLDSTSSDYDGTAESSDGSWVAGDVVDLEPYKGIDFNVAAANSKRADLPAGTQSLSATNGAVTTIFKMNTDSNLSAFNKWLMGRNVAGAANGDFLWWFQNSVSDRLTLGIQDAGGSSVARSNATNFTAGTTYMAQGSWINGGDHILYVDGSPQATKATGRTLQAHAGVAFAICSEARLSVKNNETPDFIITEHRLENTSKSDNDASTEYNNLIDPGNFISPGVPMGTAALNPTREISYGAGPTTFTLDFEQVTEIKLRKRTSKTQNEAITGTNIETILHSHDTFLDITIENTRDATLISDIALFYTAVSQGNWFTFNMDNAIPGADARKDGEWLWLEPRYKPRIGVRGTTINMTFVRPGAGN